MKIFNEIKLAQELIRFPTVKTEDKGVMKFLSKKLSSIGFKCMIIWGADKMNTEASNKLLKLIEEPPEKTVFLLITDDEDSIIQTILSRCQVLHFPPLGEGDIAKHLIDYEGLDIVIQRHRDMHDLLVAELKSIGLELFVNEHDRLPMLNSIIIPDDVNDVEVRSKLLNKYRIEIGGGLGPLTGKIWRIGLMGESSKSEYVLKLLSAFEEILPKEGFEIASGIGVEAASETYLSFD